MGSFDRGDSDPGGSCRRVCALRSVLQKARIKKNSGSTVEKGTVMSILSAARDPLIHLYIEEAPSGKCPVEEKETEYEDTSRQESDPVQCGGQDQEHDPHKFHCVSKLEVRLGIIRHGHKCHIQHDFGVEPRLSVYKCS